MKLPVLSLAATAAALCACADPYNPPPPGPPAYAAPVAAAPPMGSAVPTDACFRSSDIRNHTVGDDHTLYIDVAGRDVYRIGMSGACLAAAMPSDPIVMRQPPGTSIICRPIDMDISISKGGISSPCIVNSIVRLTPSEVAALPPRLRP